MDIGIVSATQMLNVFTPYSIKRCFQMPLSCFVRVCIPTILPISQFLFSRGRDFRWAIIRNKWRGKSLYLKPISQFLHFSLSGWKSCGGRDKKEEGGNPAISDKKHVLWKDWLGGHFYEVLILQNFINLTCNCWWAARPSVAKSSWSPAGPGT